MDLPLKIEKVAGNPSKSRACGVFNKRLNISDEGDLATVVACIVLEGPKDGEGDLVPILSDIFDAVCGKIENSQEAVLEAVERAKDAASEYAGQSGIDLNFSLTLFYREACYIARIGEEIQVLVFAGGKSGEINFEVGSGPIKSGQIYLIATKAFLSFFNIDALKQGGINLEEVIDGVATEITAQSDPSAVAAGLVQVGAASRALPGEGAASGQLTVDPSTSSGQAGSPADAVHFAKSFEGQESSVEGRQLSDEDKEDEEDAEDVEGTEDKKDKESVEESEKPVKMVSQEPELYPSRDYEPFQTSLSSNLEPVRRKMPMFKDPLKIFGFILAELKKLKSGDVGAKSRLRKNIVVLSIVILLVLGGSAFWAIKTRNDNAKNAQFNSHLETANSKYNEGVAVIDLNRQRARDLLIDAEKEAKAALEVKSKDKDAQGLLSLIGEKLKETEVQANVNFETVKELPTSVNSLSISGKNLVAVSDDKLYEINISDKEVSNVEGASGTKRGFVFDNKAFVLTSSGVKRIDLGGGKAVDVSSKTDAYDISVFFGNVYLLTNNQILKIVPIEGGYAPEANYLSGEAQFSSKSRIAIDASIWATSGNKVYKFTRGTDDHFEISGLVGDPPAGGGEFGLIYTSANLDNIYVVDTTNSALLVIGKDGKYKKALQSSEFAKATAIVVNDSEDTMYVAVGNNVLEAKLEK